MLYGHLFRGDGTKFRGARNNSSFIVWITYLQRNIAVTQQYLFCSSDVEPL